MTKNTPNLRLLAARIIDDVTQGYSLADCLEPRLNTLTDARDRAFVQALCYGVCRFYARLDVILSELLKKPMNAKDTDVHALLMVGLYQLTEMRVPAHAAVSETVDATAGFKKPWARGFVNAVLREYLRQSADVEQPTYADPEAHFAHPLWWIQAIKAAWPSDWEKILAANNVHPPLTLRVNQQLETREHYLDLLKQHDIHAHAVPEVAQGIMLETPVPVELLPNFAEGYVSVQDAAAQLAADLLMLEPHQHVLDACAAPGGKLTHVLELQPTSTVVAVEKASERMGTIKENLARLKQQANCVCDDAAAVASWWDGKLFDRILLDAPCSASGVIRRHPDIKLLREPSDIKALAKEQALLLQALWPLLKPGGLLVYATCSIFPEENTKVLESFLKTHQDAVEEKITETWGVPCSIGRQILPGMHQMDGFYYARLRKS